MRRLPEKKGIGLKRGGKMQSNPNIEKKQIVEVWDWKDTPWQYSPDVKKYCRKRRRNIEKRLFQRLIMQYITR